MRRTWRYFKRLLEKEELIYLVESLICNGRTGTSRGIVLPLRVSSLLAPGLNASTLRNTTFHPAQRVLLAAAETDAVGRVESSVSFNEVVPLKAGHSLQSVDILIDRKDVNINTVAERGEGAPSPLHTCE